MHLPGFSIHTYSLAQAISITSMSPCSRQVIRYFSIFHWLVPDKQTISPIGIRGVFFWSWCHSHCIMFDSEFWKWMDCRFTSIVVGSFHPFFAGDCLFNRFLYNRD
ncbi:uncharacterized protein LOC111241262 isoform X2 [Vigna radiata var. radiata]|uniref:Uncharacterized protein LOC111241262 isoform X2 n=1 Tax=Vigna radiata var. radiata TaxID=3916 RepID=A0A3Q0EQL1_VIGRR|nr:uncharacterized protein LOC111241262 isoform X2 [Vigna radiata var. radiata]